MHNSSLRLLDLQVGLLINFHVVALKDGIKRMVNHYQDIAVDDIEVALPQLNRRDR